MQNILNTEYE